jgi:hypothetical protein
VAVLERAYRRWEGGRTPYWQRMLVIPRYALADILSQKRYLLAYSAMLLPPLGLAIAVYLSVNLPKLQAVIPILQGFEIFEVGAGVYRRFWAWQVTLATAFTIFVGPPLLSRDMANNALPLYFSKALRRVDYLVGKALVIVLLISCASWIPLGLIYAWHWAMADSGWRQRNDGTGLALVLASVALIAVVGSLLLAVSAIVQRTRLAQLGLLAVLFISGAVAGALTGMTRSASFLALSPVAMIQRVGEWAFGAETLARDGAQLLGATVPVSRGLAVASLAAWIAASLIVLARRVRPAEVIR